MGTKKPLIQSLGRALDILELIRDSAAPLRSSDIAASMGLTAATANNILRDLFQRGYLAQDEASRYLLGAECFRLSRGASDHFDAVRRVVTSPVKALAEETGDTTFFGCDYYGSLYCAALSVGGGELVVANSQAWLDQLHCTAAGKIVISAMGMNWYSVIFKRTHPKPLTEKTIVTLEAMAQEVDSIKRDGYALCRGESSDLVSAIGVAVTNRTGGFVGALSQSFPAAFLEAGRIDPAERAALLTAVAGRLADEL